MFGRESIDILKKDKMDIKITEKVIIFISLWDK